MKIYKLSQTLNEGYDTYDTYDSAVVCAENEEEARKIHPSKYVTHHKDGKWYGTHTQNPHEEYETDNDGFTSWVPFERINEIKVEYIGEADKNIAKGIIVASYNAG